MHHARPDRAIATGARSTTNGFTRRPATTRDEFCRKVGLPADKPFFLYLCSSQFIAPDESEFIDKWVRAVRQAPTRAWQASILIRPSREPRCSADSISPSFTTWCSGRGGANPVTRVPRMTTSTRCPLGRSRRDQHECAD